MLNFSWDNFVHCDAVRGVPGGAAGDCVRHHVHGGAATASNDEGADGIVKF